MHHCTTCGNDFPCTVINCGFGRDTNVCPRCSHRQMFDRERMFVQQHPDSKYNPQNLIALMNGSKPMNHYAPPEGTPKEDNPHEL